MTARWTAGFTTAVRADRPARRPLGEGAPAGHDQGRPDSLPHRPFVARVEVPDHVGHWGPARAAVEAEYLFAALYEPEVARELGVQPPPELVHQRRAQSTALQFGRYTDLADARDEHLRPAHVDQPTLHGEMCDRPSHAVGEPQPGLLASPSPGSTDEHIGLLRECRCQKLRQRRMVRLGQRGLPADSRSQPVRRHAPNLGEVECRHHRTEVRRLVAASSVPAARRLWVIRT